MNAQELLQEIAEYCRRTGLAESTFGRRAVNDGKLTSRLRNGGRITTETLDRIRSFMSAHRETPTAERPIIIPAIKEAISMPEKVAIQPAITRAPVPEGDGQRNFRFFDNRQKY